MQETTTSVAGFENGFQAVKWAIQILRKETGKNFSLKFHTQENKVWVALHVGNNHVFNGPNAVSVEEAITSSVNGFLHKRKCLREMH